MGPSEGQIQGKPRGAGRRLPAARPQDRLLATGWFVAGAFTAGLILPAPLLAADTSRFGDLGHLVVVIAAGALAVAGGLWGLSERLSTRALRRSLKAARATAQTLLSARDAWLSAAKESLIVWGPDMREPLSFGSGGQLMELCLTGPDATACAAALDELAEKGASFQRSCRAPDGRTIMVRGRPAGGYAAVFLEVVAENAAASTDFRAILNAVPVPIWLRDKDLQLSFVNRAFLAACGSSEEAALHSNIALDRSERDLAETARTSHEAVEAKRFAVLCGHRHSLSLTLSPLRDGTLVGTAIDVTRLSEAEALLSQHLAAHADTLDRLATAVAIFGPDRKLSFYNRAYVRLWGLPEAWLDSHPGEGEILDRLRELRRLPEQRDFRAWKQERLKRFERAGESAEELWHLPGGKTLRVVTQPHPFGGLTFLFEDVSDQLRLESSYNTLIKVQKATLDTLQEGVAVFGPDGRLKLYNAAFARIWRLESSELQNEPHLKRISEACAARFGSTKAWDIVLSSITAAAPERRREWGEVERSDGTILSLAIAPLPDGATLASFVDITDHFRIEAALRERNEALEASDKLKSEFVKRISYELRTPLNSILGFSEMMKAGNAGPLNARQTEYIDAVVKSSNTLRDLINDILDLSQIEAGTMVLDLEKLDLYALLASIADHAVEWGKKIGIALRFDCREDAGHFMGDGRRLRQVVLNLLSNAFKYTPKGGQVTLGGRIQGEDVAIFVADTGSGVSPEVMPSAFERFSAGGSAVARAGMGLGLALVNRFVELHGGWVELESELGEGTRVTCHLPRKPHQASRRLAEAARA